jgi:hypothetical protein
MALNERRHEFSNLRESFIEKWGESIVQQTLVCTPRDYEGSSWLVANVLRGTRRTEKFTRIRGARESFGAF